MCLCRYCLRDSSTARRVVVHSTSLSAAPRWCSSLFTSVAALLCHCSRLRPPCPTTRDSTLSVADAPLHAALHSNDVAALCLALASSLRRDSELPPLRYRDLPALNFVHVAAPLVSVLRINLAGVAALLRHFAYVPTLPAISPTAPAPRFLASVRRRRLASHCCSPPCCAVPRRNSCFMRQEVSHFVCFRLTLL